MLVSTKIVGSWVRPSRLSPIRSSLSSVRHYYVIRNSQQILTSIQFWTEDSPTPGGGTTRRLVTRRRGRSKCIPTCGVHLSPGAARMRTKRRLNGDEIPPVGTLRAQGECALVRILGDLRHTAGRSARRRVHVCCLRVRR